MKLKIKVKRISKDIELPKITSNGDWIDLRSSCKISLGHPKAETLKRKQENNVEYRSRKVGFHSALVSLGVAIKLPEGFEAIMASRSSTAQKFGVIMSNGIGIIDETYCGDNDEWKYPCIAWQDGTINVGDRICQFRIQLSQKATVWQKLKWLFSSGVEIVEVESLDGTDRNGFGSTGIN
jgi:dUTP pyrophosphatase